MKKTIVALIVASFAMMPIAHAKNRPCSGKKGGVASCTADGKYVCNNGSISQSKSICGGGSIAITTTKSKPTSKVKTKTKATTKKSNVTQTSNPFNNLGKK